MNDRGTSNSQLDNNNNSSSSQNGRTNNSLEERRRSLERRRTIEWRREQQRREQEARMRQGIPRSIGARVRSEVKKLMSRVTEDVSGEGETEDSGGEEVRRGGTARGVGMLWKLSFLATMSLFAYVFLSGPRIQANLIPDIVEREPIPRISRHRNRRPRTNQ